MKRGERNRSQRAVRNEYQCVNPVLIEQSEDRPDEPVVKPLRLFEVAVGGAPFKVVAEFSHLLRQGVRADLRGEPFETRGQANQNLGAVGQRNQINDG